MLGDADRLQQIVWNLLSNSIKFTEPGGTVTVSLATSRTHAPAEAPRHRPGIPADFLPQMFERFRQHDASANRRHGGLGLGLSLVRQLVELHGGQVAVESTVGVGTLITVSFPSHQPVMLENGLEPSVDATASLTGARALLVEDREDALEILAAALQQMGVVVCEARSAREALSVLDAAIADGEPPDVILADIGLPDDDGFRLVQSLAARDPSNGGNIPVIAVTAYGRAEDRARALAAGFRLYLTKPVSPGTLASAILKVRSDAPPL